METKKHWNSIYQTRHDNQKSWFEELPLTSLSFIKEMNIPADAAIIDVGGGDSRLVDFLLQLGYTNITVLDISGAALDNAKKRLGEKAALVKWIESDILDFVPGQQYVCWHDRAVFHFMTDEKALSTYKKRMADAVIDDGKLIVGTFSEKGPATCSGLPVHRYSQHDLSDALSCNFKKIKCTEAVHHTPFNSIQSFTFCSFSRLPAVN